MSTEARLQEGRRELRIPALPPRLEEEVRMLRLRYAEALQCAREGNFVKGDDLRALSRSIGRLLAAEARRPPGERGMRMRELSIAVAHRFPELRDWTLDSELSHRMARVRQAAS